MSEKFSAIRGTRDITGADILKLRAIEAASRRMFSLYRYEEIRTPIFEETALFTRSIGEQTDIVEKEMYTFNDKKGRSVTLRPEGTAPVVRAYLEAHRYHAEKVSRLFYSGPMFRYERPQAGRYREFWQIGAECFGLDTPLADAEMISLNNAILQAVGITDYELVINSVGCNTCRQTYIAALKAYAETVKDKLCENCLRRMIANPLRLLDCKVPSCRELMAAAPKLIDYLDEPCKNYLAAVVRALTSVGIHALSDTNLVRGLDYYTGVVFEFKTKRLGSQDAIAAGGRYNNLVSELGGPSIPAVGFAMGADRLMSLLPDTPDKTVSAKRVFIATFPDAQQTGFTLAHACRAQGWIAEQNFLDRSLKTQLAYASENNFDFAVIIGDDELKQGIYTIKNMAAKTQTTVPGTIKDLIKSMAG